MAVYVIGEGNNFYESMTREQILAAITQAVETHTISDVDTGFVSKIKETNKNKQVFLWVGTEAEYNNVTPKDEHTIYIKTDDSTLEAINEALAQINNVNEYLSRQNKVLWEGAVNDSSTAEQKILTANGIGSYNLVALEVSTVADNTGNANAVTTILAYRCVSNVNTANPTIRFAGNNKTGALKIEDFAAIVIDNDNQCHFSYAYRDTNGNTSNIYLKKIIGVM